MAPCTIRWCGYNSQTSSFQKHGITFHRYPQDPDIKNKWIIATKRENWFPSTHSVICSRHFTEDCFMPMKNRRRLLSSAVPTMCLPLLKEGFSPSGNEYKVFCPKCNTEVQHTAKGIQEDQTKILIAKVYHYFECEYEELKKKYGDLDLTPLSKFHQRTALAIGVSEMTVLQILKEEEERNAEKREEEKRSRARKRSRQTESSSDEESSDDNVGDGGQPSYEQEPQNEPEVETLVVKIEPEFDKDPIQINTSPVQIKIEPPDDDAINTNETLALTEPAATATKRKGRKIPKRTDVTSTRQHKQGESSTSAASSSVRPTDELDESGLLGETGIKVEEIEIGDEEFG